MKKINLAVVGATGLVGSTFLKVLEESEFKEKIENLYLFASIKSSGQKVNFCGKEIEIMELTEKNIKAQKIHYAFFATPENISQRFAFVFNKYGTVVIDNSSAFRMKKDIPLIVPEVNFKKTQSKIISNPNCSTIQCMLPLNLLKKDFGIKEINYVTFQAVSGSGVNGLKDLENTQNGGSPMFYPYSIFNNCIPQIGSFRESGYTSEELKMINETKKILNQQNLKISAFCVRVPIKNCHCVVVSVKLKKKFNIDRVKKLFTSSKILVDDIAKNIYPVNDTANGKDGVFVGRVHKDISDKKVLHFWCVADNVRKGASSNGIQILERLI